MPAIVRPPMDITPKRFFEEWLPREFSRALSPTGAPGPSGRIHVRVDLAGEEGGAWDLRVAGGALSASPAETSGDPNVWVFQTVQDWRAIAIGEPGAQDLAPPTASPLDILFVDPAAQQVIGQVRGTIRFQVTGYNGRTWMLTAQFGTGPRKDQPDATVSVDAETYAGMLARRIQPPEAFFAGKIRLTGDTALAMQLGMAMMPRFNR